MFTYEITTREDSDSDARVRTVDCAYFQSDIHFVSFKNGEHKTVLAVPTDHVLAIDLKREHDGAAQSSVQLEVKAGDDSEAVREALGRAERRSELNRLR